MKVKSRNWTSRLTWMMPRFFSVWFSFQCPAALAAGQSGRRTTLPLCQSQRTLSTHWMARIHSRTDSHMHIAMKLAGRRLKTKPCTKCKAVSGSANKADCFQT